MRSIRHPISGSRGIVDIHEVAARLFAARGYHGTGMQDIASALGVRAPSLYNYVTSKRSLLDMVYMEAVQGMGQAAEQGYGLSDDVVVQIERGMEEKARWAIGHPHHLRVIWHEPWELSAEVQSEVRTLLRNQRERWRDLVQRGSDDSRLSTPSVELASLLLHEMCSWTQISRFSSEEGMHEPRLVHLFGCMALHVVGATNPRVARPPGRRDPEPRSTEKSRRLALP